MKRIATLLGLFGTLASTWAADPAFTSLPQSRALRVGDHLTFVVDASGTAPLYYQWSFNGTPINGATAKFLPLFNIQLTNAGTYTVTVTNPVGTNAASATLAVSTGLLHLFPTNLVLLRAGDGMVALAATGNSLYLDQVTTNGTYISSVAMPDSGASSLIGFNGVVDHYMGSASNNRAVLFGGFNVTKPFGGASLLTATASAASRAVGTVNGLGYYTLAVSDNNTAFDGKRLQSATSTDGTSQIWTIGSGGVILATPGLGPDVTICTTPAGRSTVAIFNNDLYVVLTGGLFDFGSLPTAASTPTKILSTSNPNDFAVSPDGNTIYMTDGTTLSGGVGGIQRWDFDTGGGVWSRSYIFTNFPAATGSNNGPDGLAVDFSGFTGGGAAGTGAIIYATTGHATQSSLIRIVDNGPSTAPAAVLYTAGVNQVIRGVRFAPQSDAPGITLQPVSVTNVPGSMVIFTVAVSGSAPFTYHWQRGGTNMLNGGNISGADTATLTLNNISAADATGYSVAISNDLGSTNSATATLTLSAADPGIALQPQNVTTNFGATVRFSVRPVGSTPISFQWQKNGADLADGPAPSGSGATVSGSTSSNLTITAVACGDSGAYSVNVMNSHGTAIGSNAVLVVIDPYISVQPSSPVLLLGSTATFSVTATGTGPLNYQWQKDATPLLDGGNISGSQTPTLTLTNLSNSDFANYSVVISGGCGTNVVSLAAALTVLTPPQSRTVQAGANVAFVVGVSSAATLTFQWSYNNTPLPGATTASYALANAQTTNTGNYSVLVSNIVAGTSASVGATLNVSAGRLHLYPTNVVVLRAGDGVAALAATGVPLFLDQLTTNGDYLSTITIPDSGPSSLLGGNGVTDEYMGAAANNRAVVFGGYNTTRPYSTTISSSLAAAVPRGIGSVNGLGYYSLAVSDTNSIYNSGRMAGVTSTDGQTQFYTTGGSGVVYVAPSLGPDVSIVNSGGRYSAAIFNGDLYASLNGGLFQFNGLPTTATSATQVLATANPNDFAISPDGNTLYLTDGSNVGNGTGGIQRWDKSGGVWNASATYTFPTPVTAITGNNGPDGMTVDFSAFTGGGASGVGAVIYATTGEATANKLVKVVDMGSDSPLTVLTTAGPNQVIRGIRFGPGTDPVSILTQPANQAVPGGNTATFSVAAAGSAPLSYQWQFNGAPISGATLAALSLTNVQPANIGSYSVVVTNDISSMTSSNATLTLTAPPPPLLQISASATTATILWTNALPSATYRVQFKSDLVAGTWSNLTPDVVATSTTASKTDVLGSGPRFYRVIVP